MKPKFTEAVLRTLQISLHVTHWTKSDRREGLASIYKRETKMSGFHDLWLLDIKTALIEGEDPEPINQIRIRYIEWALALNRMHSQLVSDDPSPLPPAKKTTRFENLPTIEGLWVSEDPRPLPPALEYYGKKTTWYEDPPTIEGLTSFHREISELWVEIEVEDVAAEEKDKEAEERIAYWTNAYCSSEVERSLRDRQIEQLRDRLDWKPNRIAFKKSYHQNLDCLVSYVGSVVEAVVPHSETSS